MSAKQLRRIVHSSRLGLLCIALLFASACSKDSAKEDNVPKAIQAVKTSAQQPVSEWAGEIAATAAQEVQVSGAYDFVGLTSKAKTNAGKASDPLCAAIKKNPAVSQTQESPNGEQQLAAFVDREMASALGRFPTVLYAEKVTWPMTWLLDSSKPPTYEGSAKDSDPQFLKSVLAAKFVGSEGAFLAPAEGSPDYPTLISWLRQTTNHFAGTVTSLTQPVVSALSDCISQQRQAK